MEHESDESEDESIYPRVTRLLFFSAQGVQAITPCAKNRYITVLEALDVQIIFFARAAKRPGKIKEWKSWKAPYAVLQEVNNMNQCVSLQ